MPSQQSQKWEKRDYLRVHIFHTAVICHEMCCWLVHTSPTRCLERLLSDDNCSCLVPLQ